MQKTHGRRPEIFYSSLIHLEKFVPRHKVPLAEKNAFFEGPADQKYAKGLEPFLSKSKNIFEKKNMTEFFSLRKSSGHVEESVSNH